MLQAMMDRRIGFCIAIEVAKVFQARDRRTASAWFMAVGIVVSGSG